LWIWFIDEEVRRKMIERSVSLECHPWCPGAWHAPGHEAELVDEVKRGSAYVQDPSSQLVAHAGNTLVPAGDFVDLCAAPGGKTALLMKLGSWRRAVALDIRLMRVRLMEDLVRRVGECGAAAADGGEPPFRSGAFDLVLLDAPCTGTGTLRRHPELRWRLQPESIADRAGVQRRLLSSALSLVSPGGVLLYATCSVEPEENEAHFAGPFEGFEAVNLGNLLPDAVPAIATDAGGIRILPNPNGDGFTIHASRRVEK
jgi:16S rRNA (cytosine967-C5)-methyltransferase